MKSGDRERGGGVEGEGQESVLKWGLSEFVCTCNVM